MQSDYYINLHFNQAVAQRTGYAFKIGDKGCTFHLHCEDLDPSGMYPHIVFNHSNNTCVEGVPTGSGRDYAYTIAGNEFGVCGKTVVDLKFYDNNNDATQRISTASFMIEIIPDTYTDFEEPSSPYADSLEHAKAELDEATSDLTDMDALFAQTLQDYIDAFGNTAPINPRGAYDPNVLYKPRDAVYYTSGGKTLTYLNNLECTGVDPTNTSNWQPIIDIPSLPAIIDNCTSTSTTDALSANQGRVLNERISNLIPDNAGAHNRYRGKALTIDADFWSHISDGTFEDQFVGDTITINGRTYILAHANYWLHTGDTACETNHWVVISPNLGNISMNSDDSTAGGYLGSGFRSGTNHDSSPNTALANCIAAIKSDFGASHILSHREYLDNAITGGYPSSGAWVDSEAELLSQIMAFGNRFFDPSTNLGATIPALYSIDKSQLALYAQRPDLLTDRSYWWLRDVVSAANFANVNPGGDTYSFGATYSFGVRLVFGIKA